VVPLIYGENKLDYTKTKKKMLTWQGSRREEVSPRSADRLFSDVTCLTRRDPGMFGSRPKEICREVLIACFVMPRALQEGTRERSVFDSNVDKEREADAKKSRREVLMARLVISRA
jgi:hypothetical protein